MDFETVSAIIRELRSLEKTFEKRIEDIEDEFLCDEDNGKIDGYKECLAYVKSRINDFVQDR